MTGDQGPQPAWLSKDDYAALGRIALASAGLDHFVEWMIWDLLEVSEDMGKVMTNNLGAGQRLQRLKELLDVRACPESLRSELESFTDLVNSTLIVRNNFLHALWLDLGEGPVRFHWKIRGQKAAKELLLSSSKSRPGELEALADATDTLFLRGGDLLRRLEQSLGETGSG